MAYRRNGAKVYEAAEVQPLPLSPEERLQRVTMLLARLLAPVPEQSLRQALTQLRLHSGGVPSRPAVIAHLRASGELDGRVVDGISYLWPSSLNDLGLSDEPECRVRFLAPFDPLVWDRRRFEHLWGWAFRLEAYTPPAKRRFGYYAMPILWRNEGIGWVNCLPNGPGSFSVKPLFLNGQSTTKKFRNAFDDEIGRLQAMTGCRLSVAGGTS